MMIQAVLSNPSHPEYGVATIPFPIPRDQYTHWVHGLWRYVTADGLADPQIVAEYRVRVAEVAAFMEARVTAAHGWNFGLADSPEKDYRGICTMWGPEIWPHEAARLAMVYALAGKVTGDAHWMQLYRTHPRGERGTGAVFWRSDDRAGRGGADIINIIMPPGSGGRNTRHRAGFAMIRLTDVYKEYSNGTQALRGMDLRIEDGEFVFLVGPSGSGKSTIIKLLTAETQATEGRVIVNGYNLSNIRRWQIPYMRRTLGVIFQDFRLIDKKTVGQNLEFAMRVIGASGREMRRRIPLWASRTRSAPIRTSSPAASSSGWPSPGPL